MFFEFTVRLKLFFGLHVIHFVAMTGASGLAAAAALSVIVAKWSKRPALGIATFGAISAAAILQFRRWAGILTPRIPDLSRPELERENKVSILIASDTHSKLTAEHVEQLPPSDVFIHCGDVTLKGTLDEVREFNELLAKVPADIKVVVAGNHDLPFDVKSGAGIDSNRGLLSSADHVIGSTGELEIAVKGKRRPLRFFGSAVTDAVSHSPMNAFQLRQDAQRDVFAKVPGQLDLLVTHGPPRGVLDRTFFGRCVGSVPLAEKLAELHRDGGAPRFHFFGHVHEQRGVCCGSTVCGQALPTTFVNAASVNLRYECRPVNSWFVSCDIDLVEGSTA